MQFNPGITVANAGLKNKKGLWILLNGPETTGQNGSAKTIVTNPNIDGLAGNGTIVTINKHY